MTAQELALKQAQHRRELIAFAESQDISTDNLPSDNLQALDVISAILVSRQTVASGRIRLYNARREAAKRVFGRH